MKVVFFFRQVNAAPVGVEAQCFRDVLPVFGTHEHPGPLPKCFCGEFGHDSPWHGDLLVARVQGIAGIAEEKLVRDAVVVSVGTRSRRLRDS